MGRKIPYALSLTPDIEREAARTVFLTNKLLEMAALHGVVPPDHPTNLSQISSGWRPPAVNAATPRAAVNSKHMDGRAVDLYDPEGEFDEWLMTIKGKASLEAIGLWMEHPASTKGWSHIQTVPPKSQNRVFYP